MTRPSRSLRDPSADRAPRPSSPDALRRNATQTPKSLWVAVGLLILAACCLGGFVVALHDAPSWARWLLLACSVGSAVPGLWLARRRHILRDVS